MIVTFSDLILRVKQNSAPSKEVSTNPSKNWTLVLSFRKAPHGRVELILLVRDWNALHETRLSI